MTYCMSDIHGCYGQYINMFEKIKFNDNDLLYVLGDVVDRGPNPIKVLQDMSMRPNVIPILGNHDFMALDILKLLMREITDDNIQKMFEEDESIRYLMEWFKIGGQSTLDEFYRLSPDERTGIIDYLSEFSLYETVNIAGSSFILTHSGLPTGARLNNLHIFGLMDWLQATVDYGKQYFKHTYLMTGHTPTFLLGEQYRGRIYQRNNHIAIDTGAGFNGGKLACICLETDEEFFT